ncbi:HK97 gp10 family phage protein [Sphingomonas endophytica]|uniref:HK97 gp10 family phage protein n=1 Tax=Sphingomonas endophytica TaxID=869719 RepID=A0ABR6N3E2_9SPHN|nr:HK97-gp10 family putative phage morphogenesis protein [Sphingomonas endophytica]MBB5725049.1 HK97 gp10 family phage protein [Sphingomonas endophytica]
MTFRSSGFRDLDRKLAALATGVPETRKRAALHAGAELIAEEARRLAPFLTGRLRDSITVADASDARVYGTLGSRIDDGTVQVYIGPVGSTDEGDVYYARFQEFGTRTMRAHPFMRPAIAARRPAAERLVTSLLLADVLTLAR